MLKLNKASSKTFFLLGAFVFLYLSTAASLNAFPNFDYDRKADFGVFRPSNRVWYSYSTEAETSAGFQWGLPTDVLTPADYDGDGLTDIAVWRPENGVWYVQRTIDKNFFQVQWGTTSAFQYGSIADVPVPADYDDDGQADFAVWRPATGVWYVLLSSKGYNYLYAKIFQWGKLGDSPVPADYDGDGKTDFAVFRSTENRWYIQKSGDNQSYSVNFGQAGDDLLVPADYDGDGKADIAVYRKGTWHILHSRDNRLEIVQFGLPADRPVPADYDGDGKIDIAVYRKGDWFILNSSTRRFSAFNYGSAADTPLASTGAKPSIVPIP